MDQSDAGAGTGEKSRLSFKRATASGECRRLVSSRRLSASMARKKIRAGSRRVISPQYVFAKSRKSFCLEWDNFRAELQHRRSWGNGYFRCVLCLIRIVCGRVGTLRSIFWKRRYNRKRQQVLLWGCHGFDGNACGQEAYRGAFPRKWCKNNNCQYQSTGIRCLIN
jgi:hypothetical protein